MLYFDITDIIDFTRSNATPTGIQRVSLRIIGNLIDAYGSGKVRLIFYHPMQRAPVAVDADFLNANYTFDKNHFHKRCGLENYQSLRDYVELRYPSWHKRLFHTLRLHISNVISGGKTFEVRGITNYRVPGHSEASNGPARGALSLAHGDTVIVMGINWRYLPYLKYLRRQRETGNIRIIQFVHDLIPLVTPEHVAPNLPARYRNWLSFMAECVDIFLVNSQSTKSDLISFLRAGHCPEPRVRVIPLAHEFAAGTPSSEMEAHKNRPGSWRLETTPAGGIRTQTFNAAQSPYALCVGTIEPRKNGLTLTKAWQSLLEELGPDIPRLLFAGKRGWMIRDFENFLNNTFCLNGYIQILECPSDAELAYLYKNCEFTVYPSYYEGWGLPIGESLWFNKFVVTSNTGSMVEVGGTLADYADPYSLESLRTVLRRLVVDKQYLADRTAAISRQELRSWKDVSNDFWAAVETAYETWSEEDAVLCLPDRSALLHSIDST